MVCSKQHHTGSKERPTGRPYLVLIVALPQVVQNRRLIQVTEAGQIIHAIQDGRVGRHQQFWLRLDDLQVFNQQQSHCCWCSDWP